jgi:hypothetical protein
MFDFAALSNGTCEFAAPSDDVNQFLALSAYAIAWASITFSASAAILLTALVFTPDAYYSAAASAMLVCIACELCAECRRRALARGSTSYPEIVGTAFLVAMIAAGAVGLIVPTNKIGIGAWCFCTALNAARVSAAVASALSVAYAARAVASALVSAIRAAGGLSSLQRSARAAAFDLAARFWASFSAARWSVKYFARVVVGARVTRSAPSVICSVRVTPQRLPARVTLSAETPSPKTDRALAFFWGHPEHGQSLRALQALLNGRADAVKSYGTLVVDAPTSPHHNSRWAVQIRIDAAGGAYDASLAQLPPPKQGSGVYSHPPAPLPFGDASIGTLLDRVCSEALAAEV